MKIFSKIALISLAFAPIADASAAEPLNNCKLRGGSMVQLAADACVMEGGVVTAATPVVPVVSNANLNLSADPKVAQAQRAVADLLIKPVRDTRMRKSLPEGVERTVKFDGCRMAVEESIHVDRGNLFSARMNFKVISSVDLRNISDDALGVAGKVISYGGGMRTYPVYFEERKRKEGNNIAISMFRQDEDGLIKYPLSASSPYWDAPKADLWMADEYGYPAGIDRDNAETSKVRILYFLNNAEDAAALKQALDDVRALCKK